jgi:hypothetical protein
MIHERTFYESVRDRDNRFRQLVRHVAIDDPAWMLGFVGWLRRDASMRSAAIVAAAEAVKTRVEQTDSPTGQRTSRERGFSRRIIDAAFARGDEPGEMLAYWTMTYGRRIPKPVKRGVGDAARRLYREFTLLRYDTARHGYRFADVLSLTHPRPFAPWQSTVFGYAVDRRHGRGQTVPEELAMVRANARLRAAAAEDPRELLYPDLVHDAGMTWEDVLSLAGPKVNKAKLWESVIPVMGLMALARNLRNFDNSGVSDAVAAQICARFADPDQVRASRAFPFRWLAAYRHAPSLRWGHALDKALSASLANVPALPGRTLILVDMSISMWSPAAGSLSDMSRCDAAAVFGAALAARAENPTLVAFGSTSRIVSAPAGGSLLRLVEAITREMGGTDTVGAVETHYRGHDRVVIITDEQTAVVRRQGVIIEVSDVVPAHVPLYTWNLAGYQYGHTPSGGRNRHTFGGLSDAAFRMIPLLEATRDATWPWELE